MGENNAGNALNKQVRVNETYRCRIEKAAQPREIFPSRLMIQATFEAIEGCE